MAVGGRDLKTPPLGRLPPKRRGPTRAKGEAPRLGHLAQIGHAGGPLHIGAAVMFAVWQPNPEIEIMGLGKVFSQGCAQRASINPAKDLAEQIADRDGVVAAGCARRPDWCHGR